MRLRDLIAVAAVFLSGAIMGATMTMVVLHLR